MSGAGQPGRQSSAWSRGLLNVALAIYPPSWRARYGQEVRALVTDCGADGRTVASLAVRAIGAWAWPASHLHDGPARMRASLATVLAAWTALAGLAVVFLQLTQGQGLRPPGHPVVGWSYLVFSIAVQFSLFSVAAGGLPLWLLMMRRALREHRLADLACLLTPVVVPCVCLGVVSLTGPLVRHTDGIGPWWFKVFVLVGCAAGGVFAAGPALALRRLRPRGPALDLAVRAACLGAVAMAIAGAASITAAVGLFFWAPRYAGFRDVRPLSVYIPLVLLAALVAVTSARRGARALVVR
jgi:hypothetical protein